VTADFAIRNGEQVVRRDRGGAWAFDRNREIAPDREVEPTVQLTLEVYDDGPCSSLTAAHFGWGLVESIGRIDLGGQTSYENRPEGGACVRVTFPLPVIQGALTS
jgi:hypothetical protein